MCCGKCSWELCSCTFGGVIQRTVRPMGSRCAHRVQVSLFLGKCPSSGWASTSLAQLGCSVGAVEGHVACLMSGRLNLKHTVVVGQATSTAAWQLIPSHGACPAARNATIV